MRPIVFFATAVLFTVINTGHAIADTIYFDDGGSHLIDNSLFQNDAICLDNNTANTPGTHVNMVNGGLVYDLAAFNNATINMYGGSVQRYLFAKDNATITMSGGSVGNFFVYDDTTINMYGGLIDSMLTAHGTSTITMSGGLVGNSLSAKDNATITMSGGSVGGRLTASGTSTITMSGGLVGYHLYAYDNATINMYGGSVLGNVWARKNATVTLTGGIVENLLYAYENANIYLDGTGFQVTDLDGNTTSLSGGDKLSDFGTLVEYIYPLEHPNTYYYLTGTITGMLSDGSDLNNTFEIYNIGPYLGVADIIIGTVPEPCSLLLLSLGSIVLLREKSNLKGNR